MNYRKTKMITKIILLLVLVTIMIAISSRVWAAFNLEELLKATDGKSGTELNKAIEEYLEAQGKNNAEGIKELEDRINNQQKQYDDAGNHSSALDNLKIKVNNYEKSFNSQQGGTGTGTGQTSGGNTR